MSKTAGRILKRDDVKLEGRFHLDAGQSAPLASEQQNKADTAPETRIVENHPEFAVVEVTCSCGTKTQIKCEYTNVQSNGRESDQTKVIGENDNAD